MGKKNDWSRTRKGTLRKKKKKKSCLFHYSTLWTKSDHRVNSSLLMRTDTRWKNCKCLLGTWSNLRSDLQGCLIKTERKGLQHVPTFGIPKAHSHPSAPRHDAARAAAPRSPLPTQAPGINPWQVCLKTEDNNHQKMTSWICCDPLDRSFSPKLLFHYNPSKQDRDTMRCIFRRCQHHLSSRSEKHALEIEIKGKIHKNEFTSSWDCGSPLWFMDLSKFESTYVKLVPS